MAIDLTMPHTALEHRPAVAELVLVGDELRRALDVPPHDELAGDRVGHPRLRVVDAGDLEDELVADLFGGADDVGHPPGAGIVVTPVGCRRR